MERCTLEILKEKKLKHITTEGLVKKDDTFTGNIEATYRNEWKIQYQEISSQLMQRIQETLKRQHMKMTKHLE